MANKQATRTSTEMEALGALGEIEEKAPIQPDLSREFNIKANKPLPEEFENPPCGTPGHLCTDPSGKYRPDWCQVKIFEQYDHQADPQKFPLMGTTYAVSLDKWTDVPPGIVEALRSAVETHHKKYADAPELKPGQEILGQRAVHVTKERPRFHFDALPSRQV